MNNIKIENYIQKRTTKKLEEMGWTVWFSPRVKFQRNDILGVFDCVALKNKSIMFIQITTLTNLSHRRKKIQDFMNENNLWHNNFYVWAWDKKKGRFKIEKITRSLDL